MLPGPGAKPLVAFGGEGVKLGNMQFKLFSIPASGDREAEEELNRFLRSHRAVSVQRELVQTGPAASWCFCVEYLLGPQPSGARNGRGGRVDYKTILSDEDFRLFARLREVRKQLAAQEAVPVYAVCTNEHLAAIARTRPTSLSELASIDGFGESKTTKYGKVLLETVQMLERAAGGENDASDRQTD